MKQLNYDQLLARLEILEEKLHDQPEQENSREATSLSLAMSRLRYAKLMVFEAKRCSLAPQRQT